MNGWKGTVAKCWSGLWMDGVVERHVGDAEPKCDFKSL